MTIIIIIVILSYYYCLNIELIEKLTFNYIVSKKIYENISKIE